MIDANKLDEIFKDCLFREDEVTGSETPDGAVVADGVVHKFAFHPGRLAEHDAEVAAMLADLPTEFQEGGGGGWSFLNAPMGRDGEQWGEQVDAEKLLCLGIALRRAACQLPRDVWSLLPGGVPYYVVYDQPKGADVV